MRPSLWAVILAILTAAAQTVLTLFIPIFLGRAIEAAIGKNDVNFSIVITNVIFIASFCVLAFFAQWLSTLCTNFASHRTVKVMRCKMFKKLNNVPLSCIDSSPHGDFVSRIVNDTEAVSEGLIAGFTTIVAGIVTILGTVGFMLMLNVRIAIMIILLSPLSMVVAYFVARVSREKFLLQAAKRGEMFDFCNELLMGQKVVKAFSFEQRATEKFSEINSSLQDAGTKAMFTSSLSNPSSRFVNGIVYALVALFGSMAVLNSSTAFTIGALTSLLAYATQYTKPFNEVTGVLTEFASSLASLRRIDSLLCQPEQSSEEGLEPLENCDGTVRAEHVYFSYTDAPLITDFNINIKKGMRVAIVGPTGCGKTTLINLLMRFYDPLSGNIIFSGRNAMQIPRSSLRSHYGMVLQETWLFNGTYKQNIAYANPNATDEEIQNAAKSASIHRFIMRQEKGYDTPIGDVSQGQRQLLTIARTMLTTPPMLILDEATSNIDTRTEQRISKAFKTMMQGKTCFIIAHRLSTIVDADLILVMNKGNIIESGTHRELIGKGGFYYNLFNSQFAVY